MTTSRIEPRQPRISVIFDRPRVTVRTAAALSPAMPRIPGMPNCSFMVLPTPPTMNR